MDYRPGFRSFLNLLLTLTFVIACSGNRPVDYRTALPAYEKKIEALRQEFNIPAFSAAIVKDSQIVWAKGFGMADLEKKIKATDTTTYLLASITKTFASTIILQLVEQGKVRLDDPISRYGVSLDTARAYGMSVSSEDSIKVIHLMTHTAEGVPGTRFNYNGYLFSLLDKIIETASGRTFGELVMENIVRPTRMKQTAPNICDTVDFRLAGVDSASFMANAAVPYAVDSLGQVCPWRYETYFGTAAGLMTSAVDLARYSIAIDQNRFITKASQDLAFTSTISNSGDTLPYGLGWFVQTLRGKKLLWHYGLWTTNSSLILKIPEDSLTLVILSNANLLTAPYNLGAGNILSSPHAVEFINTFVFPHDKLPVIDYRLPYSELKTRLLKADIDKNRDWILRQLFGLSGYYHLTGQTSEVTKLMQIYNEVFAKPTPVPFADETMIACIDSVGNLADRTVLFKIDKTTEAAVFAVGEGMEQMFDYGWIENVADGDVVWEMNLAQTSHAGGSPKNRMANARIVLEPGTYKLRYKSDDSHAFMAWNNDPPDYAFYGIAVFSVK